MHLCSDEITALGLLGSIGTVCRYCWHRVTAWCRRGGGVMGRDHSYECEVCGEMRGGMNDQPCSCDPHPWYGPCDGFGPDESCSECTGKTSGGRSIHGTDEDVADQIESIRAMGLQLRLNRLAGNLVIGAALCRAYWQGIRYQPYPPSATREPYWQPGCGRQAP